MEINALCRSHRLNADHSGGVEAHAAEAAGRVGRHRDVIFLVSGGWQAVNAARMRQRFVLRRQRCSSDLRNHKAGVNAAIIDEERR